MRCDLIAVVAICLAGSTAAQALNPGMGPGMGAGVGEEQSPVDRGQYLVQAANCFSCHTTPGGKPFAGGNAFETTHRALGKIYSSNITPDQQTGLGAWSEEDLIKALRDGVAPSGKHFFPAFPYTAFTRLTIADMKAIYAYLRTVPPVQQESRKASFWFRQRWAVTLWNSLSFKKGELTPDPAQSQTWNRGYYLVEALGHCGACHTPRNFLMAERANAPFTGGVEVGEVEAGKLRKWSAPNLTSAQSGLALWSADDLRKYLKSGYCRRTGVLGPMNEVIANSLRHLTDSDVDAMATYIKSLPAKGDSPLQSLSPDASAAGKRLYDRYCDECHLSSGRGGFRKAPAVAGSAIVQARSAASLVNIILYGATPAPGTSGSFDAWENMEGFKDRMNDAQVAELANFLRSSWGNRGGPISASFVAGQR